MTFVTKTKIVATIGPATCTQTAIMQLKQSGASMFRLNGSHADLDWHENVIKLIKATEPDIPILLDIPGRKIRTIQLDNEPDFEINDRITLTTDLTNSINKVPVNYRSLHLDLKAGDLIYADDGTLKFHVHEIINQDIICIAASKGTLRSRKGINVPFVNLKTAMVTDRDKLMVDFATRNEVNYIGISFVESKAHVDAIRKLIGNHKTLIVAKIENRNGLLNCDEIIEAADTIMIDRGDLSVETSIEELAINQKKLVNACRTHAKPVIIATEMLHTMIENPTPTKAEITDITNAILDGASAVMLSGETAVGNYPYEAVSLMSKVAVIAENYQRAQSNNYSQVSTIPLAFGGSIANLANALPITKIIAITKSGYAARVVSSYGVNQPIIAITNDRMTATSFNVYSNVRGYYADIEFLRNSMEHIPLCLKKLWDDHLISTDDTILVTAVAFPVTGNRMNLIQTFKVEDLSQSLGW